MDDSLHEGFIILEPQSGEVSTSVSQPYTTHENVEFTDADPGYTYNIDDYVDPTRVMQDSDDADLGNFFKRPLKIASYQWSPSVTFGEDLNPWELYFKNPRVINRIANYKLLRCKMKVKILINGTQFHYGRVLAAYEPLATFNQTGIPTTLIRQDLVRASQLPHIFLDPCTSTGGELELPFMWYYNYLDIPSSEWVNMGKLYLRELNDLNHANGATDPITISVFAWAEDVSLSVLTSRNPSVLVAQSGTKKKSTGNQPKKSQNTTSGKSAKKKTNPGMSTPAEKAEANTSGLVSGPATAVAKVAGALKVVPWLTPFATATEMAANTTAGIAKLFGYSRPTVSVDPEPFKPHAISSLATTTVPDGVEKLTVDDQQELSLDTRIAGIGATDPLSIKEIASRESYLTTFSWSPSDTPETLLWNCRVMPTLWEESGTGAAKAFHFPACCAAALPFEFWTGSMNFRFQIVKSNFHKGRIKLVYDPDYIASNEYNTNYLHVIDITEKTDFTVTIGNGQQYTLLDRFNPGVRSKTECYSTTPYTDKEFGNGTLGVYVVNELAVPNTDINNSIEVNVFVSMGDDFEVFVPVDDFMNFQFYRDSGAPAILNAQSGEIEKSEESPTATAANYAPDEQDNEPVQSESCQLGPDMQYDTEVNKVYTGEAIESFRPLLKRYNIWASTGNTDGQSSVYAGRLPMFPMYRGYVPGAIGTQDPEGRPYNFNNTTLLHWVTMGFQGWRGSIRWKILPRGLTTSLTAYVQRHPVRKNDNGSIQMVVVDPQSLTNQNAKARSVVKSNTVPLQHPTMGANGHTYRVDKINPAVEFEMPFYNQERFYPGKQIDYSSVSLLGVETFDYRIFADQPNTSACDFHVAAGDDFQVYMWTGMPRLYYETGPPLASP